MGLLIIPAVIALLLLAYIAVEERIHRRGHMARPLSRRELKRLYRQKCAQPLPATIKMRLLLAEARSHYL